MGGALEDKRGACVFRMLRCFRWQFWVLFVCLFLLPNGLVGYGLCRHVFGGVLSTVSVLQFVWMSPWLLAGFPGREDSAVVCVMCSQSQETCWFNSLYICLYT